jgi:antitoxin CcdA
MSSATRKNASRPKRLMKRRVATNLSLRSDLVERAKSLGLNLSEVVEATLDQAIAKAEQLRWLAENEKAIDYYNSFVEEHGLFGEEFREL